MSEICHTSLLFFFFEIQYMSLFEKEIVEQLLHKFFHVTLSNIGPIE
jgi:hypothetical protein